MWTVLSDKIVSILNANSLIKSGQVFSHEEEDYGGDPVATVIPSSNAGDYSTNVENERIYAFSIKLFVERTKRGASNCESVMRKLVDSVIDDFDKDFTFSGITPPTGYAMLFVEAAPSSWGYLDGEVMYRVAEISLRCHVDVNVQLIS